MQGCLHAVGIVLDVPLPGVAGAADVAIDPTKLATLERRNIGSPNQPTNAHSEFVE